MEELRKDVECTSTVLPHAAVAAAANAAAAAGAHGHQMAAAVAAFAQRNLAVSGAAPHPQHPMALSAAGSPLGLKLAHPAALAAAHPGGVPHHLSSPLNLHQSPPSSRESMMSPRSPMISESGSPPIRVTDSDG